jgi:hypothetical protein
MTRFVFPQLALLTVFFLLAPSCVEAAEGERPAAGVRAAVRPFLEALRTGNPNTLDGLAGQSIASFREALSADPQYARMIRHRYQNAVLEIRDVTFPSEKEALVDISVEYPDGTRDDILYSVVRTPAGTWILEAEIRKP